MDYDGRHNPTMLRAAVHPLVTPARAFYFGFGA